MKPILRFSKLKENGSKFFDYILLLNSAKNVEGNDVGIIFVDRPYFSKIAKNCLKTAKLKIEIFASDKVGCTKLALQIRSCTIFWKNE